MAKVYDALRRAEEERRKLSDPRHAAHRSPGVGARRSTPETPPAPKPPRASLFRRLWPKRMRGRGRRRLQQAPDRAAPARLVRGRAVPRAARPDRCAGDARAADPHDRDDERAARRGQDHGVDQSRAGHRALARAPRAVDRLRSAPPARAQRARAAAQGRSRRGAHRRRDVRGSGRARGRRRPRRARGARSAGESLGAARLAEHARSDRGGRASATTG